MEPRINLFAKGQKAMNALFALGNYVNHASLDRHLIELVEFRVSQINGCAFCLDMHSKDLRAKGETEQRLYGLDAWHEAPYYTDRERAALAWAEAVTNLSPGRVPDEVFQTARKQFSEEELIDLTMVVVVINGYNRINVAFRMPAGDYKVGQFGE
jgi:AhpD family alkylhydroperoxidase